MLGAAVVMLRNMTEIVLKNDPYPNQNDQVHLEQPHRQISDGSWGV